RLNLSIDAMTLVQLPSFQVNQPKLAYFKRRMSVIPMGVFDETTKQAVTYVYDSKQGKTAFSHVISVIPRHLSSIDPRPFNELLLTLTIVRSTKIIFCRDIFSHW